jgi:toxin secretion/phage lysis holin
MNYDGIPKMIAYGVGIGAGIWFGLEPIFQVLLVVMGADIVLGTLAAFYNKRLDSGVMFRGMTRKIGILILVTVAQFLEVNMSAHPVGDAAAGAFAAAEGLSAIEKAGMMNIVVPQFLKDALAKLNPGSHDPPPGPA